jgi:hypothetical protein
VYRSVRWEARKSTAAQDGRDAQSVILAPSADPRPIRIGDHPGVPQVTGAEALVRMLALHEVEVLFGLCGDTSLPFYDALARLDHGIRHVLCRDERSAGYMADGYARVTGKVGVCEGPERRPRTDFHPQHRRHA